MSLASYNPSRANSGANRATHFSPPPGVPWLGACHVPSREHRARWPIRARSYLSAGETTATAISATFGHEPGVGIAAESAGGGWTQGRASVEVWVALFAPIVSFIDYVNQDADTAKGFRLIAEGMRSRSRWTFKAGHGEDFAKGKARFTPAGNAFRDQRFAEDDAEGVVDLQDGDGDAADRRAADPGWPLASGNASPISGGGD